MSATGAQAEETASQAKLAAAAYEAAFAATVPPPVIAANRALLAALVATNLLGQNTAAIAATEADYAEMWAQDAAAMYAYAGSAATASTLTSFTEPPQTTNAAGPATQAAAVAQSATVSGSSTASQLSQLVTSIPSALQSLATSTGVGLPPVPQVLTDWNTIWSTITGPYFVQGLSTIPGGPFLSFGQAYAWPQNGLGAAAILGGPKLITGALAPLTSGTAVKPMLSAASFGGAGSAVSGSMGRAAVVGSMSVPPGWTEAAPAIRTLASVLPTDMAAPAALGGEGGAFSQMALASLAGRAVASGATYSGGGSASAAALGGVAAQADPATATIIVIPALDE